VRHLRSVLYALVLAPAVWILCGVGFDQDLTGRARDNGGIESLSGVLLLLLAGAAYAILLFAPISPTGPLLAGLVLAGVGAWARIAPDSYAGVWPANVAQDGFDVSTPGYGLAVLLAVPLLAVALSARRWRGFQPLEFLLIGTIGGRARVAGTPMASEETTVIREASLPPAPLQPAPASLQAAGPATGELDDGDEKTTVMQFGRPAVPVAEQVTEDIGRSEEATRDVAASSPPPAAAEEITRNVTGDETTRIVAPAGANGDDRTEVVRAGRVDPPGDRTQLLTFHPPTSVAPASVAPASSVPASVAPAPGAAVAEETKPMSIAGAERPDPGEDPTTRLTPPGRDPGEATTRANPAVRPTTVTGSERPADEASDDTRPLTLPAQRPPVEDDTTRRL
jgi:hypothetical protein